MKISSSLEWEGSFDGGVNNKQCEYDARALFAL